MARREPQTLQGSPGGFDTRPHPLTEDCRLNNVRSSGEASRRGGFLMDAEAAKAQGNPVAAFAYLLGFVSGLLLLYTEPYSKDEFVRFHARQSIAFSALWFAVNVVLIVFVGLAPRPLGNLLRVVQDLINLALAVLWVVLMYKAYYGEKYRIPEISDWAERIGF
jgi:uncharacterized membrane protein